MEIDTLFAEPYAAERAHVRERGGHAAYVVVIIVLVMVCAGLTVAYLQTRQSAADWQLSAERRSSELQLVRQEREEAAKRLAESEARLIEARDTMATTAGQLDEAAQKIKALTDEQTKALDRATFLPAATEMANQLVQELGTCVGHVQGLQGQLGGEGVEPAFILARATEIGGVCNQAKADSEAFTKWLASQ